LFNPENAAPFQIAQFQILYDSWFARVIRATIFLAGAAYAGTAFGSLTDLTMVNVNLVTYLWGLLALWEGFYIFKIRSINVGDPVGATNNLADSFSTRAARLLLQSGPNLNQLLLATLKTGFGQFFLAKAGLSEKDIRKDDGWGSFDDFIAKVKAVTTLEGWPYVTEHDLLSGLAYVPGPFKKSIFDHEITEDDLRNILFWAAQEENAVERRYAFWREDSLVATKGIAEDWAYGYTLSLDQYSRDITKELTSGRIRAYLVGRDKELDETQKILSRSGTKNVLLLGEAGVGKTTVVQALALKSLDGLTLPPIRYKRFLQLDLTSLLSGAEAGEVEARVKALLQDAERAGNVILVIPDVQYLAGAGEGVVQSDLTGLFQSALEGSRLQVIALTDHAGFKKFIEPHKSFLATFEVIEIPESTEEESIRVLEKVAPEIEVRQKVSLTYSGLKAAVQLAKRYLPDKELPGKAIDLLDEAAVEVAAAGKKELSAADIAAVVTRKTRIPVGKVTEPEKDKLLHLEEILHQRIVGQEEAISAVSNAIRRARAGLRDDKRPIGVYLFLGPTGVGKTETSKALAEAYYGDEKRMVRLDMSEYATPGDLNKLLGGPGEAGSLTEAIRDNPYSLVLLDELEKADAKVQDTFLQVFDDGRLTDGTGRTVDFTNAIIIATSNAGAEGIREMILERRDLQSEKANLLDSIQKSGIFKPELLNRFDEIVLFRPLTIPEIVKVVALLLKSLDKRLAAQEIDLEITDAAVKKIAETGYDPVFGARPLRRYIQDHVEGVFAKKLLDGSVKRGDTITLDVDDLGDLSTQVFK